MLRFAFTTSLLARVATSCPKSSARLLSTSATVSDNDADDAPSVTLFQYAICPFCSKAKALISYAGIRPKIVEVNPLTKTELKGLSSDYRKVPIALIDGKQANGSDAIVGRLLKNSHVISTLENNWISAIDGGDQMTMKSFRSSDAATRWIKFANDDLAGLMYPNICRTLGDSYSAFGYVNNVHNTFNPVQKAMIKGIGSLAMYFAASKMKKKRHIDDEQKALTEAIICWEQEGLDGGNKAYASGLGTPNLGDITVYGVLRSVEGLPAHEFALNSSEVVNDWYARMEKDVQK